MFLLKDTSQWRGLGSNPRPLDLKSSTLPLSHCVPIGSNIECSSFSTYFRPKTPFLSVISDFQVSMHIPSGLSLRSSGFGSIECSRIFRNLKKYKKKSDPIRSYFCPQLLSVSITFLRDCAQVQSRMSLESSLLGIVLNRVWSSAVFRPWTFPVRNNVWCEVISRSQYTVYCFEVCLFVCFVALRPKSTAMVIAGRSVHLTTLFSWASLNKQVTSTSCKYFGL